MSETWIFYLKYGSFVYLAKGMKVKLPSWELGLLDFCNLIDELDLFEDLK